MADILYSQVMMDAIKSAVVRRGSFFRDRFFGNIRTFGEKVAQYDVITDSVNELAFDGYEGQATSYRMGSWETAFINFECLKASRNILPSDLAQRLPGYTAYDSPDKIAELQRLSWEENEADLLNTEEQLCLRGIKTGNVTASDSQGNTITLASWTARTLTTASQDLSDEGEVVAWVMSLVQNVIGANGAAPNTLVVGSDIGNAIAKAFANGRRHMEDGAVNPALDYANESIAYLGSVAGVQVFVCGNSNLLGAKNAIIGSQGENLMCYGPTFIPADGAFSKVLGRRSMYTIVGQDPVGMKNILQSAPCPVVRRAADVLYITLTAIVA